MHNELIGNDWVEFTLQAGAAASDENEIEALLAAVAELDDAQFIHATVLILFGRRAAAHLREEWQAASGIDNAEDFIEALGSRSSGTGETLLHRFRQRQDRALRSMATRATANYSRSGTETTATRVNLVSAVIAILGYRR